MEMQQWAIILYLLSTSIRLQQAQHQAPLALVVNLLLKENYQNLKLDNPASRSF